MPCYVALAEPEGSSFGRHPCGPPEGALWAFVAHHKTGHVLLNELGKQIAVSRFKREGALHGRKWSSSASCRSQLWPQCIAPHLGAVHRHGLLVFFYPPCEQPYLCKQFARGASMSASAAASTHSHRCSGEQSCETTIGQESPKSMRLLHFVRDPVNVTISSYFYHLYSRGTGADLGDEPLLHDLGGHRVRHWAQFCADLSRAGERRVNSSESKHLDGIRGSIELASAGSVELAFACNASAATVSSPYNWSYQGLLRSLPLRVGLMVEAWFAMEVTIKPEANAATSLHAQQAQAGAAEHARFALQVDLQDSLDAFDATWSRIFRHLLGAVPEAHIAMCVRSVRRHDLGRRKRRGGDSSHASSAPHQMHSAAETVLRRSEWFQGTLRTLGWKPTQRASHR